MSICSLDFDWTDDAKLLTLTFFFFFLFSEQIKMCTFSYVDTVIVANFFKIIIIII